MLCVKSGGACTLKVNVVHLVFGYHKINTKVNNFTHLNYAASFETQKVQRFSKCCDVLERSIAAVAAMVTAGR